VRDYGPVGGPERHEHQGKPPDGGDPGPNRRDDICAELRKREGRRRKQDEAQNAKCRRHRCCATRADEPHVDPFDARVKQAECRQEVEGSVQEEIGGAAGFQRDRQAHRKEGQTVDEEDEREPLHVLFGSSLPGYSRISASDHIARTMVGFRSGMGKTMSRGWCSTHC